MSLAGIHTFNENLNKLMNSEAFKKADESERLDWGYRLLNSKFGLNMLPNKLGIFQFGEIKPILEKSKMKKEKSEIYLMSADEVNKKIKRIKLLAIVCALFIFDGAMRMFVDDMGMENYITFIRKHWIDLSPWIGFIEVALALIFFILIGRKNNNG